MGRVSWTHEAQSWLKDIHDYITGDNPTAAIGVVSGIYEKCQILARFPKMGHRYEGIPDREVRILLYGHYRIAYLVKDNDDVDILGVFHGALDIKKYLL